MKNLPIEQLALNTRSVRLDLANAPLVALSHQPTTVATVPVEVATTNHLFYFGLYCAVEPFEANTSHQKTIVREEDDVQDAPILVKGPMEPTKQQLTITN